MQLSPCVPLFLLPNVDVICDLLLDRHMATRKLFVNYKCCKQKMHETIKNVIQNVYVVHNFKITSSPVSDQSTPRHALKNRHSTASTMSSPNISPIKPLLSVPETPTSTRRPYLSRQSFSPMECSTNVLESSGIEIIGDAFPDLSPIKANSRTDSNHVHLETGRLCSMHEVSICFLKESGIDNNVTHRWPSRMASLTIAIFLRRSFKCLSTLSFRTRLV